MRAEHVVVLTTDERETGLILDRVKYPIRALHGDRVVLSVDRRAEINPDEFNVSDYLNALRDSFVYFDMSVPTPVVTRAMLKSGQPFGILHQRGCLDRLYHYAQRLGQILVLAIRAGVPDSKDDRILQMLETLEFSA